MCAKVSSLASFIGETHLEVEVQLLENKLTNEYHEHDWILYIYIKDNNEGEMEVHNYEYDSWDEEW